MKSATLIAAIAIGISGIAHAEAPDLEAGGKLYKNECRACHGPTAKGLASYPKLAGKTQEYLVDRLEQYRAGKRLGPNTALMAPRAKNLSDDDITNITGFIVENFK
ncbi:MAG: c-type cytochrome [Pseudomonadota bacterium]